MIQTIYPELKRASYLNEFLSESTTEISFYDIVYVLKDGDSYKKKLIESLNCDITLAFSNKDEACLNGDEVIVIMLGKLISELENKDFINVIGIDLSLDSGKFTQFIFTPYYDNLTKQYLISPRDEAIALLSIDSISHQHMGVQTTFFSINNKYLPEDSETRKKLLTDVVEDISFIIPRISQPKGSANIICLLLNLDDPVEEKAFIRNYRTNEIYTDVLFVTSDLKLQTGELESIDYDGVNIEGIYTPIIERQRSLHRENYSNPL